MLEKHRLQQKQEPRLKTLYLSRDNFLEMYRGY